MRARGITQARIFVDGMLGILIRSSENGVHSHEPAWRRDRPAESIW